jgi:hypothetical protein
MLMRARPLTVRVIKKGMTSSRPIEDAPLSEIINRELTYRHHEIQEIMMIEIKFRGDV